MFSSGLEAEKRYEIGNFFPHNRTLKKMLEDVESEGFQFNPQNDTLLFYVSFVVGGLHAILLLKRRQGYLITTSQQRVV